MDLVTNLTKAHFIFWPLHIQRISLEKSGSPQGTILVNPYGYCASSRATIVEVPSSDIPIGTQDLQRESLFNIPSWETPMVAKRVSLLEVDPQRLLWMSPIIEGRSPYDLILVDSYGHLNPTNGEIVTACKISRNSKIFHKSNDYLSFSLSA